jgi:mannose-1-phosphate guanylyltransferase/mannose-6-phosphate isomerase
MTHAILLAGGSGTRLWPVSRELYPKQLVNFIGQDSLVQSTIKRLLPVIDPQRLLIVCGQEHRFEIARHIEALGIPAAGKIVTEPCGRNTAPAILLATLQVAMTGGSGVLCVFPADHVIRDAAKFHEQVRRAVHLAQQGMVVTFGIRPDYPETGYGYIEGGEPLGEGGLRIRRFVEKPDLATAQEYLASGRFFWNSGMFAFRGDVLLAEFERHAPEMLAALREMTVGGAVPIRAAYERLPDQSIDCAIMEKTERGVVLPSDFGWSDIGSWKSLYAFSEKDADGNVIDGDVLAHETRGCFLMGRERLIATHRLTDMVVVETPDAVFVSDLESSREVKSIVSALKARGRLEYQKHKTVHQDWGSFTALEATALYRVARLLIYPGASLSLATAPGWDKHLTVIRGQIEKDPGPSGAIGVGGCLHCGAGQECTITNTGAAPMLLLELEIARETAT